MGTGRKDSFYSLITYVLGAREAPDSMRKEGGGERKSGKSDCEAQETVAFVLKTESGCSTDMFTGISSPLAVGAQHKFPAQCFRFSTHQTALEVLSVIDKVE